VLTDIETGMAFALGLLAATPFLWLMWRNMGHARGDAALAVREQVRGDAILDASPDGLFIWDLETGAEVCSRRLAVMLDLSEGTNARFNHIRTCFTDVDARSLEAQVLELRRYGTGFERSLPATVHDRQRRVRITGIRAGEAAGGPLADVLWFRDVTDEAAPAEDNVPDVDAEAARPGHFQSFLDALPWPVWMRDEELNVAFANRACLGEDLGVRTRSLAARAREAGEPLSESHLMTAGERPRLFEITESPVRGWLGSFGYAVDRSDAESLEGQFTQDTQARNQVLETLNTAVAIYGQDKNLVFSNAAFSELWKLDGAWLAAGPSLSDVLDRLREKRRLPEVADWATFREEQLNRFGTLSQPVEQLLHLPDGSTLREVVSPQAHGGLVFTYEDVTRGLSLERTLKTLTAVQGETLNNLYEGVCVFGSDGRLKLFNPAFARLWGFDDTLLEGKPHMSRIVDAMESRLSDGEPDTWTEIREEIIARLIGRQPSSGRIVCNDGAVLDYANVPLPDGAVLLSYLNVTDSARVEHALRQRAEALEEAGKLKSEFIANVSHEVRTPINTIIGFADMLAGEHFGKLNTRQMEYGLGILESSKNLMTLIDDILDLAAIEAGLMRLELDTVDLHVLMASVMGLIRERARSKALDLEFDCLPDIGWIVADEKRLKQILFNLLSNAVEFTPGGGTVRMTAERKKDVAMLTVTDTGVGIPKAELETIMQAFERGTPPRVRDGDDEESQDRSGAGLGLSLVKRFVELHDGSVEIKSRPGRGTSVTVRLPLKAGSVMAGETPDLFTEDRGEAESAG